MKQSEKSEITRAKILASAETEFANNGLSASRVDSIAKNAGVNKQLIYAHFESKENLYSVVLENVYSRLAEFETKVSEKEFTGISVIGDVILDYFDFLLTNPAFVRLMLWENLNNASYVKETGRGLFEGVTKLLKTGIEKGVISPDIDVMQTSMSVNMFCFSAFSNIHTMSKLLGLDLSVSGEMKKRADHIADVIIKYISKSDSK